VRLASGRLASALMLVWVPALAAAQAVPLPRERPLPAGTSEPMPEQSAVQTAPVPSACRLRLTADLAVAPSLPPITGPGECGAPDVVRLEAVVLADGRHVAVAPPAVMRCSLAEAIVGWVREDAAPRTLALGSPLAGIENFDSYECRGRNRIPGAKLSEHGKANALDIRSFKLASGQRVELTDPHVGKEFRDGLRASVCGRFTTVLGPGSDGYHEDHVHVDLAERRGGYRICEWDVRTPDEQAAVAVVPLPRPRPAVDPRTTNE
jgi:hypothetical protein